jgi:hypothetical protein
MSEIDDPITGEIIDTESIDHMLDRFSAIKEYHARLNLTLLLLREAIAAKAEGDGVTRRVAGRYWRARVTMPDERFDQSTLRRLWVEYPELAQEYLRVAALDVKRVEVKKLINTSSDQEDFKAFRSALLSANEGRKGAPTITIERSEL